MTVTFLDGSTLSSTTETIDFTTDRLVTSVSVEFNPGAATGFRETVFDGTSDVDNSGGDFSNLYRTSTRSGSGPYTWAIRRSGKWPAPFRIRVKESDPPTPVPATGAPWGVIYQADLRTLATQSFGSLGSYSLAGATWWLRGQFTFTGGYVRSSSASNGVGLIINSNGPGPEPGSAAGRANLRWTIPLAQFSNYNPSAPVMVLARGFSAGLGNAFPVAGLLAAAPATGDLTAAEHSTEGGLGMPVESSSVSWSYYRQTAVNTTTSRSAATANAGGTVFGILSAYGKDSAPVALGWSSHSPAPDPMSAADDIANNQLIYKPSVAVDRSLLTCVLQAGSGASNQALFTDLYILQPRL